MLDLWTIFIENLIRISDGTKLTEKEGIEPNIKLRMNKWVARPMHQNLVDMQDIYHFGRNFISALTGLKDQHRCKPFIANTLSISSLIEVYY